MSRLYEALKGASRNPGDGNGHDQLWNALEIDSLETSSTQIGIQHSEALPNAFDSEREGPVALELAEEATALEVDAPEVDAQEVDAPEGEVELATEAHATLNQKARLLPFAVNPMVADHYRRLRTKVLQQRELRPFRSLVVTSAAPQEGKTVTVLNLALSLAALPDCRVLVIDGDLRRGNVGSWLGVSDDQPGLSELFVGTAKLEDVVLKSDQVPIHFIVRGKAIVHDLHPSHFAGHFQKLSELYDLVLIDSPPANVLADVQLLAANSDAILLVARAFSTTKRALERAAQELAPFRIIGAVLNAGVTQKSGRYYGYY